MVVFTCNHCGESLQKPRVEKHYNFTCRAEKFLTCVDCFTDFRGEDYNVHTKCVSEEQRYSGKDFVEKIKKGEVKQESWMEMIKSILMHEQNLEPRCKSLLNTISDYNNVPRKRAKFINFIKSSTGGRTNSGDIESVWDIIEKYKAQNKSSQENSLKIEETDSIPSKKKKKSKNGIEEITDVIAELRNDETKTEDSIKNELKNKKDKKKSKPSLIESENIDVLAKNENEVSRSENGVENEAINKKKRKSKNGGIVNDIAKLSEENIVDTVADNQNEISQTENEPKNKKKNKANEDIVNDIADVPRKKRKSVLTTESENIEQNVNAIENIADVITENQNEVSQTENEATNKENKKKLKLNNEEIVNDIANLSDVPRKKRKSILTTESESVEQNVNGIEKIGQNQIEISLTENEARNKKNKSKIKNEEIVNHVAILSEAPRKKRKSALTTKLDSAEQNMNGTENITDVIANNQSEVLHTENEATNTKHKKKTKENNEEIVSDVAILSVATRKKRKSGLTTESKCFEQNINGTENITNVNVSNQSEILQTENSIENEAMNKKTKKKIKANNEETLNDDVLCKKKKSISTTESQNAGQTFNGTDQIADITKNAKEISEVENGVTNKKKKKRKSEKYEEIINILSEMPQKKKNFDLAAKSETVTENINEITSSSEKTELSLDNEILQVLTKKGVIPKSKLYKKLLKKFENVTEPSVPEEKMLKKIDKTLKKCNNIIIEDDYVKLIK